MFVYNKQKQIFKCELESAVSSSNRGIFMEYDTRNVVYRGEESGRPAVNDGIIKLTYDLETMDKGVSNWGMSDFSEFSVVKEDGTGFWSGEAELDNGYGLIYINSRPPTDEEVDRILSEHEARGLEEMTDREKEWENYIQCTFIDTSKRRFDNVRDFDSKARNIIESRDRSQIVEGLSKIYSNEELGF